MQKIYCENIKKILVNKTQIEETLGVKLSILKGIVDINSDDPEKEIICLEIIEAINLGFSVPQALDLRLDDFTFEKVSVKDVSRKRDLSQIRARIIGTRRRALNQLEALTNTEIVLHDNVIGIIGETENVKRAAYALRKLIQGSKHSNVYMFLEKENAKERSSFY